MSCGANGSGSGCCCCGCGGGGQRLAVPRVNEAQNAVLQLHERLPEILRRFEVSPDLLLEPRESVSDLHGVDVSGQWRDLLGILRDGHEVAGEEDSVELSIPNRRRDGGREADDEAPLDDGLHVVVVDVVGQHDFSACQGWLRPHQCHTAHVSLLIEPSVHHHLLLGALNFEEVADLRHEVFLRGRDQQDEVAR